MLCHLVVIPKGGRGPPAGVAELLSSPFPPLSEFRFVDSFRHGQWSSAHGTVHFAGWETEADLHGTGPSWHASEDSLSAVSGSLRLRGGVRRGGKSVAAMFADHLDSENPARIAEACDGVYTAIRLDSSGTGAALTDVLGLRHLYAGENDQVFAVSTQAEAVAQILAQLSGPERDVVGVAGLAFSGFLIGNRTGFTGVRRLDPGEAVALESTRPAQPARFEVYDPAPWSSGRDLDSLSRSDLVTLFAAELIEGVRVAAEARVEHRRADITGGRDSRLILAAILQDGLQDRFRFRTLGADDLGDVEIGTSIARALDLDHSAGRGFDPAPPEQRSASFESRARRFVAATGGTVNLWDDELVRTPLPQIHLCGLGGEVLRTYWPKRQ